MTEPSEQPGAATPAIVRVTAPSRLHFGLLALPSSDPGQRHFGGAGLMVRQPGLTVRAEPAVSWSATGPFPERVIAFARRFEESLPPASPRRAFALHVEHAPAEHIGLGTGTQLGMCVAQALATALGVPHDAADLARRIGRGERSGIGVHGFSRGGFLVDGGKGPNTRLAPLLSHMEFPQEWRVLLLMPRQTQGLHGKAEREAFLKARTLSTERRTDELCRLLLLGVLPALAERDLATFGPLLSEFNHKVGEMFSPWQGGPYASSHVAQIVRSLTEMGVASGQSSWGPTVFAIAEEGKALFVRNQLRKLDLGDLDVVVARGCNQGAVVEKSY